MTSTSSPDPQVAHPTLPRVPGVAGFAFGGQRCGIKHARPDLGVVTCDPATSTAGCFTQNKVRAACVDRNAATLPTSGIRALIVNSGNANAMTGPEGATANAQMAASLAKALGAEPKAVLTASTGIIGVPLPLELIEEGAAALAESVTDDAEPFARAIVTTDTSIKVAHLDVTLPGADAPIRLLGVAKGSGMVHPNMATTLGFVFTDALVSPPQLQEALRRTIDPTFNAISIDGDTSTNDMVLAFASGVSGVHIESEDRARAFDAALESVLLTLAKQVAADGEGATRLLEVEVRGAPTAEIARKLARGVCKSSLVKCSAFTGKQEFGRVGMALGQAALEQDVEIDPARVKISADASLLYDAAAASSKRTGPTRPSDAEQRWSIELGLGPASATAYGCDLSYDYVRINADEAKQIEVSRAGGVSRNLTLASYSPRLKHQLLCEGLAYVRRFTGLRILVYLQPSSRLTTPVASLAHDLELCLDAGLRPIAVVPDKDTATEIEEHMRGSGHFASLVSPDPTAIGRDLDRGKLCVLVRPLPAPDELIDLSLRLGIGKLIAMGEAQGLQDAHGFVQRLPPDMFLAGLERGRFDSSDPDLLMLAKHAATRGVPALHIVDARVPHAVVGELFTDDGVGTLITRQAAAR